MTTPDGSKIKSFKGVQQGPAFTLSIDLVGGHHVDIDLVAAISFEPSNFQRFPEIWKNMSGSQWLKGRDETHQKRLIEGLKKDGFLVPISAKKLGPEWSIHFPMAEKEILWNLGCVKPVIRFLKQFRDAQGPKLAKLKVGLYLSTICESSPLICNIFVKRSLSKLKVLLKTNLSKLILSLSFF